MQIKSNYIPNKREYNFFNKGYIKIIYELFIFFLRRVAKVAQDIVTAAEMVGMKVMGPVPLPTRHRKFALLRSPFKHKKSYEHFEIRTHKRLLWVEGTPERVRRFIDFTVDTMEPIATLKVREHNYHRLTTFYSSPVSTAAAIDEARAAALASPSSSGSSSS